MHSTRIDWNRSWAVTQWVLGSQIVGPISKVMSWSATKQVTTNGWSLCRHGWSGCTFCLWDPGSDIKQLSSYKVALGPKSVSNTFRTGDFKRMDRKVSCTCDGPKGIFKSHRLVCSKTLANRSLWIASPFLMASFDRSRRLETYVCIASARWSGRTRSMRTTPSVRNDSAYGCWRNKIGDSIPAMMEASSSPRWISFRCWSCFMSSIGDDPIRRSRRCAIADRCKSCWWSMPKEETSFMPMHSIMTTSLRNEATIF